MIIDLLKMIKSFKFNNCLKSFDVKIDGYI